MSRFTGRLHLIELKPGVAWELGEPLHYEVENGGLRWGFILTVPKGFRTNGASIPPALRLLLAVWGTYGRAAVVHDYLYEGLRSGEDRILGTWVPSYMRGLRGSVRRRADDEFYWAMRASGTARWLALLIWASVRLFGAPYARPTQ